MMGMEMGRNEDGSVTNLNVRKLAQFIAAKTESVNQAFAGWSDWFLTIQNDIPADRRQEVVINTYKDLWKCAYLDLVSELIDNPGFSEVAKVEMIVELHRQVRKIFEQEISALGAPILPFRR